MPARLKAALLFRKKLKSYEPSNYKFHAALLRIPVTPLRLDPDI